MKYSGLIMIRSICFVVILLFSSWVRFLYKIDIHDKEIREVKIGQQVWMSENLNVNHFRNGDIIREARTEDEWIAASNNKQPAWCYYDNNSFNGDKFGKLYNWYAVSDARGLAPEGWSVPTNDDWITLIQYLGDNMVGDKLKFNDLWARGGSGSNQTGFNALPGGCRGFFDGHFTKLSQFGYWWTSTKSNENKAYFRMLGYIFDNLQSDQARFGNGFSVRCVKNIAN
jgi:uncharacterized protein (TIGR02145 family)